MQSPTSSSNVFQPAPASSANPRLVIGCAIVIALHVGLFAIALNMRDRPMPRPIEAKTISAQLISETPQPAPQPQPVAVESPPPPKPVPKPIPKPVPKPKVKPKIEPAPKPMPVTDAPSQIAAPAPDPTPPAPPQAAPPPAAPAIGKPTMEITAPKDISHLNCSIAAPDYPAMARRRGETGRVVVAMTVGLNGKFEDVRVQKSSGSSRLDDAALDAVRGSACSPFKQDGQAVRVPTSVPIDFTLKD